MNQDAQTVDDAGQVRRIPLEKKTTNHLAVSRMSLSAARSFSFAFRIERDSIGPAILANPVGVPRLRSVILVERGDRASHV